MSTFWQVLRLAFWINPLQRVLTCLGVVIVVTGLLLALPFPLPGSTLPLPFLGVLFISTASVLVGGVYLRLVSAPRIVRLAPHGRQRLLFSVIGLILLIALLWVSQYWLFFLRWVDPKFHPSFVSQLAGMAGSAVVTSAALVGLFIASRSPFAALLVVVVLFSPGLAAKYFDADLRLLGGLRGELGTLALIWIPFGVWFLKVRRISAPHWLAGDGQDVLATTLISTTGPKSQREALERLLLGGTTVVRFGLQWLLVLALLLGMQWMLARVGDPSDPALVHRVMIASLCIVPIVTTVVSFAAIRRSRALWLLVTSSRVEFFACIDRILMRLNGVMVLVHALWLAVLWFAFSWPPGPFLEQLHSAQLNWMLLWVPGFFVVSAQLARLPKWPVAIVVLAALYFLWPLSAAGSLGYLATMLLLIVAIIATFALRVLARRRWREGDFPRVVTSAAS